MQFFRLLDWGPWFLSTDIPAPLQVAGSYNPWLVALSLLMAVAASCAAMHLSISARVEKRLTSRWAALGAGAIALGAGTWSMHFIGMLAFQLCTQVTYDPGATLLSMLPSLLASTLALWLLARPQISRAQLWIGGILVGSGIGAMHYGGMLAMRMQAQLAFDPVTFIVSIVLAVTLAVLALWIRFDLAQRSRLSNRSLNLLAGSVMGLAIGSMHYMGMAAARFIGEADPGFDPLNAPQAPMALGVAVVAASIGALAVTVQSLLRAQSLNQRLRDSETRLRAVLETAVDGMFSADKNGCILSFNASAERIFGWSADSIVGRDIRHLMWPSPQATDADELRVELRQHLDSLIGAGREIMGRRQDGGLVSLRVAISRTESNGERLYLGIVTDITGRKATEIALRNRETQYRTLIANMPGVAFRSEAGLHTRLEFVSDRIEALTGWPAEDFVENGRSFDALVHPGDLARTQKVKALAMERDEAYAVEYRLTRRDGQERWISETAGGGHDIDGALRWIDGVMQDVTDERLRSQAFETMANVLDRAMAVVEIAPDGLILACNPNYVAMMGYERADELLGRPYRDMMPAHELALADQQRTLEALRRGEVLAGEFERVGKDGRQLWIQATYNPVLDSAGQLLKMVAFKTDITQRKLMECELRKATALAEQAANARASFLANMSHEIRTPMNAILGFTDVLLTTTLAPTQRRHLETVRQAGQSLMGLLNDILDTAKLDKGAVELEVHDFSLHQLCDQVVSSLRLAAEKKGLALTLSCAATLPPYHMGDALRIQQVLMNLVGNAIKFTHKGGVALSVDRRAETTVISVTDTGIGIAPDRVERIFDAFAQADATITRQFGGTGLGTTIARQLTELMGGHLVVQSKLGVGSCFEVHLPLPVGQAPSEVLALVGSELPPLKVLVADDVPQNVELLELLLQANGHQVTSARNGRDALALIGTQPFDLVLMDMHMPELDGLSATRALRAHERAQALRAIPVIALTASVQAADRLAAQQAGMDGFATKPVQRDQLFDEIARVLGLAPGKTNAEPAPEIDTHAVVDWDHGLRLWVSRERLQAAIAGFLQAQAGTGRELEDALARQDTSTLIALAHRIAGAAGNLALPQLRLAAQALERAARTRQSVSMAATVPALRLQLEALSTVVPALGLPSSPDAEGLSSADPHALRAPLQALRSALQRSELDEDALLHLTELMPSADATPLIAAIDAFEFDAALHCVDQLLSRLPHPTPKPLPAASLA